MIRRKKTSIFLDAKESTTVSDLKKMVRGITKRAVEDMKLYKDEQVSTELVNTSAVDCLNSLFTWLEDDTFCSDGKIRLLEKTIDRIRYDTAQNIAIRCGPNAPPYMYITAYTSKPTVNSPQLMYLNVAFSLTPSHALECRGKSSQAFKCSRWHSDAGDRTVSKIEHQ